MRSPNVHVRSLATSTALSVYYVADLITPLQVIAVLNEAGVKFVLMGAHAIGGWMRSPRATEGVDVLVAGRGGQKAAPAPPPPPPPHPAARGHTSPRPRPPPPQHLRH